MKKKLSLPDYPIMYKMNILRGRAMNFHFGDFLFSYVYSGEGIMNIAGKEYTLTKGIGWILAPDIQITFCTETTMQIIHIRISEDAVKDFLLHASSFPEAIKKTDEKDDTPSALPVVNHVLLKGLVSGIELGIDNDLRANEPLVYLKIQECINILTYLRPGLRNWFFRMNSLQKIALKDFMECHYQDNLPLERLAQASGRSLSTFRRDFQKEFGMSPGKWLLGRRLEEAYMLITEKKAKPSDILMDLGFESFSHFSRSFKKRFGMQPSMLLKQNKATKAI